MVQLSHPYMATGNIIAFTIQTSISKIMSLLSNLLSAYVIAVLPRSKYLNFMAQVTICSDFWSPGKKVCYCFHCIPIYLPWSDGTRCHDLLPWMLIFKPAVSLCSSTFIKRLLISSSLSAIRVVSSAHLRLLMFLLGNLDSSLCFIQPSISHDVLWI